MSVVFSANEGKDGESNEAKDPKLSKWLKDMKLSRYASKFDDINCSFDDLFLLDNDFDINDFLSDIGITIKLHKLKLKNEIKKLRNNNSNISQNIQNIINDVNALTDNIIKANKSVLDKKTFINSERNRITDTINAYFDEYIKQINKRRATLLQKLNEKINTFEDVLSKYKENNDKLKGNIIKFNRNISDRITRNDNDDMETQIIRENDNIFKSNEYKMYTKLDTTMNDINIQFIKDSNDCQKQLTNLIRNLGSVVSNQTNNNETNNNDKKEDNIPQTNFKWINKTSSLLVTNNGLTFESKKIDKYPTIMFGDYISKSKNISSFECNIVINSATSSLGFWAIGFVTNKFNKWDHNFCNCEIEGIFFYNEGTVFKSYDFESQYKHIECIFKKKKLWLATNDIISVSINMNTNTGMITNITKDITVTTKIPDIVGLAIYGCAWYMDLKCTVKDYKIKYM